MTKIKILRNFFTPEECEFYVEYIDKNLDKFYKTEQATRFSLLFGRDLAHKEKSELTLDLIADIEPKVQQLFRRVESSIEVEYSDENKLHVCSFFMSKQVEGSAVSLHYDTDDGLNAHFGYGGVIYLNTMNQDGQLNFPHINYSYSPIAGDFIVFPPGDPTYSHEVKKISEDRYSLPIWLTDDAAWKID
jgi:hypothetical protein